MKKAITIFLTIALIAPTFVNVGIGVYYQLNKDYISQKLCENRSNPKMHCNGHCYLSKQLKKAEERENKSLRLIKEKEDMMVSPLKALRVSRFPLPRTANIIVPDFSLYTCGEYHSLLKPPIV